MALDNPVYLVSSFKDETVEFYLLRVDRELIERVIKLAAVEFGATKEINSKKVSLNKYAPKEKGMMIDEGVVLEESVTETSGLSYTSVGTGKMDVSGLLELADVNLKVATYPPFLGELLKYIKDISSTNHLFAAIDEIEENKDEKVRALALSIKEAIHKETLISCNAGSYPQTLYELSNHPDPNIAHQAIDILGGSRISQDTIIEVESGEFIGRKKMTVGAYLKTLSHR